MSEHSPDGLWVGVTLKREKIVRESVLCGTVGAGGLNRNLRFRRMYVE
jgi:hypothetical protein